MDSLDANEIYFDADGDRYSGDRGRKLNELPPVVQAQVVRRMGSDFFDTDDQVINRISGQPVFFDSRGNRVVKDWFLASELEESGKKCACDKNRDFNVVHDWYEFTVSDWKEKLATLGYLGEIEINFSGFSSQGDGASFTCRSIDVREWILRSCRPELEEGT